MANEIVKYHNNMNNVRFKDFTSKELDVFMAIISRLKDKNNTTIVLDFWYLKQLIGWRNNTSKSFYLTLNSMYNKLIKLTCEIEIKPNVFSYFVLFNTFTTDLNNQTVEIRVNPLFNYILNNLTKNFTRYELEMYSKLNSKYTKIFFSITKQYSFGFWEINLKDFKDLLDIPNSYAISDIDKKVLTPISEELKDIYNLKIIKNFDKKSLRGRPKLVSYRFEFKTDVSSSNAPKEKIKNYKIGKYNFKKYIENETWLLITSKKNKDYESLSKIVDIYLQNSKIKMDMFGAFSHENQTHTFESEKHLMNFIEKFRYKKDK